MNVCEKRQIGARGVRLFTCLKAAHIFPAIFLNAAPFLCFLNCPCVPTLLSPAAEKDSDCADGGKRVDWQH